MFRFDRSHHRPETGVWFLVSIILICCAVEAVLLVADIFALAQRLRPAVYENGAFWVGLLHHWQPNYAAQPYIMFLTYGFLHAGILHLVVNMVTLWSLSRGVIERVGTHSCTQLYFGAMIGGGAGHAALATRTTPMIGASGALFGLAGALLVWACVDRLARQETLWPVLHLALFLVVLNVVSWWAMDGQLAWQAHLGGFVSGGLLALLIDPHPCFHGGMSD